MRTKKTFTRFHFHFMDRLYRSFGTCRKESKNFRMMSRIAVDSASIAYFDRIYSQATMSVDTSSDSEVSVAAPVDETKGSPVASTSLKTLDDAEEATASEGEQSGSESEGDDEHDGLEKSSATFESLGLIPQICEACALLKFKAPTPIQADTIPYALQGKDVIGLAQTGSGKTAAFALPIIQALWDNPQPYFACVLAPTRELAYQISEQFTALGSTIGVRCVVLVGGMDMMEQSIALSKRPHIIVATPGRLQDHLENTKGFSLRSLKYLVSPIYILELALR